MKIVKYRDHSCEKRAKRRAGKDLQDEVDVERVENEGAMAHDEKIKGDGAQPGARCKKGGSGEGKYAAAMERTGTGIRSNGHHVMREMASCRPPPPSRG
jgi:hypothetical protein